MLCSKVTTDAAAPEPEETSAQALPGPPHEPKSQTPPQDTAMSLSSASIAALAVRLRSTAQASAPARSPSRGRSRSSSRHSRRASPRGPSPVPEGPALRREGLPTNVLVDRRGDLFVYTLQGGAREVEEALQVRDRVLRAQPGPNQLTARDILPVELRKECVDALQARWWEEAANQAIIRQWPTTLSRQTGVPEVAPGLPGRLPPQVWWHGLAPFPVGHR